MNQSEDIKDLVGALSKAQGQMKPAVFNKVNPHYKNRYADFTSCMDAVREPLCANGLSIMQYCDTMGDKLYLVTMLAHVSGQWIKSFFPLNPSKMDSQGIGSAMTYGKRYSLSAMLGIVSDDDDDDGQASIQQTKTQQIPPNSRGNLKISAADAALLHSIEQDLDKGKRDKLMGWMKSTFQVERIEDLLVDDLKKVMNAFERAQKHVEEVANA